MTVEPSGYRAASDDASLLLKVDKLTKDFVGLRALDEVSLDLHSGEVVAVVGHNGSGKSTLVKVLAGIYAPDGGRVILAKNESFTTGLYIIHQDLGLVGELSTVENLSLSKYASWSAAAPFHLDRERKRAKELISQFGGTFDVDAPISTLAPAQRSIIAISRALDGWDHDHNVLILDEPTEALHASEVHILFEAIKKVAAVGAGVIFISHRLDEVLGLADRVVVLRDGKKVADEKRNLVDHDRLVSYVTGVPSGTGQSGRENRISDTAEVLAFKGLCGSTLESLDLSVRKGEIVGVAGVLGSGREELPAVIFGASPSVDEEFYLQGEPYERRTPSRSIRRGMGFVAGDRTRYGSIRVMTARENVTLPELGSLRNRFGALKMRKERIQVEKLMNKYDVRPPRSEQVFGKFSGGNQQKIVFAKWLRNRPAVLLLEEPTQGVDIGAKQAIYEAIEGAAGQGTGVMVCSSEAKELVRLCDRVVVLRAGRVVAELAGRELTEERLVLEGHGLLKPPKTAESDWRRP